MAAASRRARARQDDDARDRKEALAAGRRMVARTRAPASTPPALPRTTWRVGTGAHVQDDGAEPAPGEHPAAVANGDGMLPGRPRPSAPQAMSQRGRRVISPVVPVLAVIALLVGGGLAALAALGSGSTAPVSVTGRSTNSGTTNSHRHRPNSGKHAARTGRAGTQQTRTTPAGHTSSTPTATTPPASSPTTPTSSPTASAPSPGTTASAPSPRTTTSGTVSGGSASAPVVSSVSPAAGAAGQTVVVTGSGFYSTNGQITAEFGGQAAPISCPAQTSCTLTVPDLGSAPRHVTLTILSTGGASNGVAFTYQ